MRPRPKNDNERLACNEGLLRSVTVKFEEAERDFIIGRLQAVPAAARTESERNLLDRLMRYGTRMIKLSGPDRAWIIDRASRVKPKRAGTDRILEKVRS